jgi:DNA-binding transcriptional MerR regulator
MGRSPEMIRAWEKNGLIPKTSYTDSRGWRLYTSDQIDLLGIAIKNFKSKQWDKDMVKKFLSENWQRP